MSQLVFSVLKKRISIYGELWLSRKFLLAFSSHHAETITYHDESGQKFEDMEPEQYLLLRTFIYFTEKKKVVDAPD